MKIIIVASKADNILFDQNQNYIGVDHGVEILQRQGINPVFVVGDFDSLENKDSIKGINAKILPERKDVTDTHSALEWAIDNGYDDIDIYGATGGRLDHFMAAMCLLEKYQDYNIRIIDEQNEIRLLKKGKHLIEKNEYKYFSLFALKECLVTIKGAKYNLDNYFLKREDPLCVSNEVDTSVELIIDNSIYFIFSKEK